jgi:prepilin-type N-terminal cleavage/methylation domain-containing protein
MTPHTEQQQTPARGMTLVELLVVVAILLILSVVVLPSITGTIDSRRIREGARAVSTFIARAQSRAIGATDPRGFILQPSAADPEVAIDFYFADVPPVYAGQAIDSRATLDYGMAVLPSSAQVTFLDPATATRLATTDLARDGDGIQFGGRGPFYRFTPATSTVRMWPDNNQSPRNTPWPQASADGMPFKIRRQPARASAGLLQLQRGAAIDLAWSTIGDRVLSSSLPDAALGAAISGRIVANQGFPICVLFDGSGKPTDLYHSGGVRTVVAEPIFLLVGLAELCGNPPVNLAPGESATDQEDRRGANWQYSDAAWLCIDNNTGIVKFGPVDPRATNVLASQRYIRMTVGLGVTEN